MYRGVLDRQWLRTRPEFLRSLYGVYPVAEWTMVGQVTHLPGLPEPVNTSSANNGATAGDSGQPSMRDPFRGMFKSTSVFERMFLESDERVEVMVVPLAIYREYTLPGPTTVNEPSI